MKILDTKYTKPIEREYEGWIISCIEDYFKKINKQVRIFAVSPALESTFPADEVLSFDFKILGLQFKKASVSALRTNQTRVDYSNIHWTLADPPGQFPLIQSMSEIFYCLPTFVNRDFKNVSLDHCIFWRPENNMTAGPFWYDNPNARNAHNQNISDNAMRWGKFIEKIYSCSIGSYRTATQITRDILIDAILNDYNLDVSTEGLYAIIIEIQEASTNSL